MPLSSQKQVMAANDKLAARAAAKITGPYRKRTIGPMVEAIATAKSVDGLRKRLPGLIETMDTSDMEKALADVEVQGAMIGRVTAQARDRERGTGIRDE